MEKKNDEKVRVFYHPYVPQKAGAAPQKPKPKSAAEKPQKAVSKKAEPKKIVQEKPPAELSPPADDMTQRLEELRARMRNASSSAEGAENNSNTEVLLAGILVQMEELTSIMKEMKTGTVAVSETKLEEHAIKPPPKEPDAAPKKKKKYGWIGEVAFYAVLLVLLVGVFFISSNSEGRPSSFAGFSAFTVLTGSMEEVIPQGSLVVTKVVDPNTLQVGDDITFMSGPTSTITHRIINIIPNYADTGQPGFETKGVMNQNPDKEPVAAANVVGIVVFHSKMLGTVANFISDNWPFMIFIVVVIVALFQVLKFILKDDSEKPPKKPKEKPIKKIKSE